MTLASTSQLRVEHRFSTWVDSCVIIRQTSFNCPLIRHQNLMEQPIVKIRMHIWGVDRTRQGNQQFLKRAVADQMENYWYKLRVFVLDHRKLHTICPGVKKWFSLQKVSKCNPWKFYRTSAPVNCCELVIGFCEFFSFRIFAERLKAVGPYLVYTERIWGPGKTTYAFSANANVLSANFPFSVLPADGEGGYVSTLAERFWERIHCFTPPQGFAKFCLMYFFNIERTSF